MVKISVIMPVYNGEKFIETACESLSNQTFDDFELICVNDGSTDNSLEKIYSLAEKYKFIKILNQDNQGSGEARNNGLNNALGEYVAFLDADDIFIDDDALEQMYSFGIKNDADMVAANLKRVSVDGVIEENFNYIDGNYAYFDDFGVIYPEEYGIPWAFYKNIFKKSFLNQHYIRFPDLKRGQDPVFLADILANINQISVVPVDLYGYNYASGGGPNKKVNSYEKKYDYIKHFQDTFDILEESGFNKLFEKYKEKLFLYLSLEDNADDRELFNIVHKIFGNNIDYYNTFIEELLFLRMNLINTNDMNIAKKNFDDLRFEMYNFTLNESYFLDTNLMKYFVEISSIFENINMDSYFLNLVKKDNENIKDINIELNNLVNETKLDIKDLIINKLENENKSILNNNMELSSKIDKLESQNIEYDKQNKVLNTDLNSLKNENEDLIRKNNKLDSDIKKLKIKNHELDELNNDILNSNSWKTTKPLRNFRHLLKNKER